MVAELLPSPDRDVNRSESLPEVVWVTPQDRQNLKLPGMNQAEGEANDGNVPIRQRDKVLSLQRPPLVVAEEFAFP